MVTASSLAPVPGMPLAQVPPMATALGSNSSMPREAASRPLAPTADQATQTPGISPPPSSSAVPWEPGPEVGESVHLLRKWGLSFCLLPQPAPVPFLQLRVNLTGAKRRVGDRRPRWCSEDHACCSTLCLSFRNEWRFQLLLLTKAGKINCGCYFEILVLWLFRDGEASRSGGKGVISLFPLHARPHGAHQVGEPWARTLTDFCGRNRPWCIVM